jgi:hypothetical protein
MSDCPKGGLHDWRLISEKDGWLEHRCMKCKQTVRRPQRKKTA